MSAAYVAVIATAVAVGAAVHGWRAVKHLRRKWRCAELLRMFEPPRPSGAVAPAEGEGETP